MRSVMLNTAIAAFSVRSRPMNASTRPLTCSSAGPRFDALVVTASVVADAKFGGHSFWIPTPDGLIVYDGGKLLSMRIQSVRDLQVVAKAALQH